MVDNSTWKFVSHTDATTLANLILMLMFIIESSHGLVSGTDPRLSHTIPDVSDAAGQHGLYHPAVVVDVPALECECIAYSPVASSTDPVYSHVEPSACREGGQVDFNVAVRGLVPGFEYDMEITWTLSGDELRHTWKSVVAAATEYYKLREPLVQRNDDFHFGMLAWDVYKKGDDRFYIDVTVRDMYHWLTTEEAVIGTRNIDTAVNNVRLNCAEHPSAFLTNTFSRERASFKHFPLGMQAQMPALRSADRSVQDARVLNLNLLGGSAKDTVPLSQDEGYHGLYHPAVVIDIPELECECKDSFSIEATTIEAGACREGGEAYWKLSVRGLIVGFVYQIRFEWFVGGDQPDFYWDTAFNTSTSSYTVRLPLSQIIQKARDLNIDTSVWDGYSPMKEPLFIEVPCATCTTA